MANLFRNNTTKLTRRIFLYFLCVTFLSITSLGFFWVQNILHEYKKEVSLLKKTFSETKRLEIKSKILEIKDYIQWIQNDKSDIVIHTLKNQIEQLRFPLLTDSVKNVETFPEEYKDSITISRIPVYVINKKGELVYSYNPFCENKKNKFSDEELTILEKIKNQNGNSKNELSIYKKINKSDSVLTAVAFSDASVISNFKIVSIVNSRNFQDILQIHILDSIFRLRYTENEYVFINTLEGKALVTHGKYNRYPIDILKSKDSNWIKIFQVQQFSSTKPDGVYYQYTWNKLATKGSSLKTAYFSYIPSWKWIIGTGFYDDDINKIILAKKEKLHADIQNSIIHIFFYLVISALLCYILVWFFSKQFEKNIELFKTFFEKASKEHIEIDKSQVTYREFMFMADAANLMVIERKKIEEKLLESESHYRFLFEQNPAPMLIYELGTLDLLLVNDAFVKLYGFTKEEALQLKLPDLYPDEEKQLISDLTTKLSGLEYVGEWHHIKKDGNKITIEANSHGFIMEGKNSRVAVVNDITVRKQVEDDIRVLNANLEAKVEERTHELINLTQELQAINEELKTMNEELYDSNSEVQKANIELTKQKKELHDTIEELQFTQKRLVDSEKMASIGILAAGVAHEINNPLNFIKGSIYALNDFFNDAAVIHLKDQVQVLLDSIDDGVTRVSNIVTSLNHFSRQSGDKMEKCDIHSIIENCLVMIQSKTKYKAIINKNYTQDSFVLMGNDGKLHQVLLNVLVNAIDAIEETDKKGIIDISTKCIQNSVIIQITDNGLGIKEEILDKIINPFFTTKEPGKGTGLGLAITHKIITEHKGAIDFKSEYGKGTTVTITLPADLISLF